MIDRSHQGRMRRWALRLAAGAGLAALGLASGLLPAHAEAPLPFEITVDGQRVDGSDMPAATPADTSKLDVEVKFDGLGVTPMLNVSTMPPRATFRRGDTVRFLGSLNYAAWVDHAEIRILSREGREFTRVFQIIELGNDAAAEWVLPKDAPDEMEYVLRVYDAQGRYDETQPLPLSVSDKDFATHANGEAAVAPGYSEDRTAIRNIDVSGGAFTVYGSNVPEGHDVTVAGEPVPVDADGSFVVQRILPPGHHTVDVAVTQNGEGLHFTRDVEIPENEWFYVGLADFTAGYRLGGHVEEVRTGEFDNKVYTKGRLAFYLKGKIKGRYILTAAADTGESRLKSIFQGLDEKDPRQFLKRIDPDDYYPVYGDDSTAIEDAPTKGKFYVKLQRGQSHIMWGNFKSNITGSKILRSERALYGAQGVYRSSTPAPDGGATTALDAHAALPGTLPTRESFRGTGGSAYFLKHQDVTPGSETVTIEVRNAITGWVVQRRTLNYGEDYSFDYVQGVAILKNPLPSSAGVGTENYLVASYEYTPAARDVDGYVTGGRAQQWLGNKVRIGVTAMREKTEGADQNLYGADVRLHHTQNTYLEAEVARSEGPGFGSSYSPDGGLTVQDTPSAGTRGNKALAWRVEGHAALEDLTDNGATGSISARVDHYGKGFSSLDVEADKARTVYGIEGDVKLSENSKAAASYSDERVAGGQVNREGLAKVRMGVNEKLAVEPYGRYVQKQEGTAALPASTGEQGKRADAGIKLIYAWDEDHEGYVFGQGTVVQTGTMHKDNRAGVGGHVRLSEKVTADGEVSHGSQGLGAALTLNYEPTADNRYYLGYQLDPQRSIADNWPFALVGDDLGTIVAGARHRFSEQWSAFGEDNFDVFGERLSLTQVYGVTYTPDAAWTITGGVESGVVYDNTIDPVTLKKNQDLDRTALSLAVAYRDEDGLEGRVKGEWRNDDSADNTADVQAYLLQATFGANMSDDWRAIASADVVLTDATDSTRAGDYAEGSMGFAYRPAQGDRLNVLAKYTFLYDNPGSAQVGVDGTLDSPSQLSHIASVDVNYDVTPKLTLGAKYGVRYGRIKDRTVGSGWQNSQAHLGVLRADLHIVNEWDAMLEGRMLWSPTTHETDYGIVAAVYRQFGDNMKVGIGYNFGRFSDDLRDLTLNDHGVFLNVIGKL